MKRITDKERLDWLEIRQAAVLRFMPINSRYRVRAAACDGLDCGEGMTAREAIDAAMGKQWTEYNKWYGRTLVPRKRAERRKP